MKTSLVALALKYARLTSANNILVLQSFFLLAAAQRKRSLRASMGGVAAKRSSLAPVLISFATNLDL